MNDMGFTSYKFLSWFLKKIYSKNVEKKIKQMFDKLGAMVYNVKIIEVEFVLKLKGLTDVYNKKLRRVQT